VCERERERESKRTREFVYDIVRTNALFKKDLFFLVWCAVPVRSLIFILLEERRGHAKKTDKEKRRVTSKL